MITIILIYYYSYDYNYSVGILAGWNLNGIVIVSPMFISFIWKKWRKTISIENRYLSQVLIDHRN